MMSDEEVKSLSHYFRNTILGLFLISIRFDDALAELFFSEMNRFKIGNFLGSFLGAVVYGGFIYILLCGLLHLASRRVKYGSGWRYVTWGILALSNWSIVYGLYRQYGFISEVFVSNHRLNGFAAASIILKTFLVIFYLSASWSLSVRLFRLGKLNEKP